MDEPTTHSPTCYREHHACAVARLDRLREAMEGMPPGAWLHVDIVSLSVTVVVNGGARTVRLYPAHVEDLLVAVRDITEGR